MKKKPPPPPPFWRNPRNLGIVIGLASAVLVAAGAAAIMLNSPGDFSTVPHVKRLSPTTSTGQSTTPPPAPVTAATATTATTSETSPESPAPEQVAPRPSESAPEPSRATAPTQLSPRQSPPSMRVEATRNPMSFHPSPISKP